MKLPHNAICNDEERQLVLDAMVRLRDNRAERSNGARTVVALAAESGVSRQRLYEHHSDLLNDFKSTVGVGPVDVKVEAIQRQLVGAHAENQELIAENSLLRAKIRTLAAVITELSHDAAERVVVPMPRDSLR